MEEKSNNKKEESFPSKVFTNAAMLVALFTGVLYAAGSAYYGASLMSWGLDFHQFQLSFHEICYMGLIALFNWSISWIPQLMLTVSLVVLSFLFIIFIYPPIKLKIWIKENIKLSEEQYVLSEKVGTFHNLIAGTFILFLLFGLTLYGCEVLGKEKTNKSIQQISNGESKLLYSSSKNNLSEGYSHFYLIECNLIQCAVYWTEEREVEIVSRKSIEGSFISL